MYGKDRQCDYKCNYRVNDMQVFTKINKFNIKTCMKIIALYQIINLNAST